MHWRIEVLRSVFGQEPGKRLLVASRQYYRKHIPDDSHIAFVALYEGQDAGCGAICLTDELPSPDNPSGHCAYLMNIYVKESFRKKGIAKNIVMRLIEEAKKRDCDKIYLETTPGAYTLYRSCGFHELPAIMKYYEADS